MKNFYFSGGYVEYCSNSPKIVVHSDVHYYLMIFSKTNNMEKPINKQSNEIK